MQQLLLLCDANISCLAPTALATLLVNAAFKLSFYLWHLKKCEEKDVKGNTNSCQICLHCCQPLGIKHKTKSSVFTISGPKYITVCCKKQLKAMKFHVIFVTWDVDTHFYVCVCPSFSLTLCCQWWHVLVWAPVDLVSVRIHSQHQHHDASHDAPGNRTYRCAFDHVQRCHLFVCKRNREDKRRGRGNQKVVFKKEVTKDFRWLKKWQYNKMIYSTGSEINSCCNANASSILPLFSHQC